MRLTGKCESCGKKGPTEVYGTDYRIRYEEFELCRECIEECEA